MELHEGVCEWGAVLRNVQKVSRQSDVEMGFQLA